MKQQLRLPTNPATLQTIKTINRLFVPGCITNDAGMAAKLSIIDTQYRVDRAEASNLPLAEKLIAYREAGKRKVAAYQQVVGKEFYA